MNTIHPSLCPSPLTGSPPPLNTINPYCPSRSVLPSPRLDEPLSIDIPLNEYTLSPNLYNNISTSPNSSNSASEKFVLSDQYIFPLPPPVAFRSLVFIAPPEHRSQASVSYNNPGEQSDTDQANSMHKKNILTTNAATAAAIVAFKNGATELQAMLIGNDAAKKARKSYSQKAASKSTSNVNIRNNVKNNGVSIKQLPNQIGTNQNAAHSTSSQQCMAAQHNVSSSDTLQNPVKEHPQ